MIEEASRRGFRVTSGDSEDSTSICVYAKEKEQDLDT